MVDVNKTFESSKEKESVLFHIQQDNTEEIDETYDNAEWISEVKLFTSEKVWCPIETFQTVDIRVIEGNMNTDREFYPSSEKTVDLQETISDNTMSTSINDGTKRWKLLLRIQNQWEVLVLELQKEQ